MYQTLQMIGSFCGLFAVGFSVFDRLIKGRPLASVSFQRSGQELSPRIRITNISPYDVAVLGVKVTPAVYICALSDDPKDLLRAQWGQPIEFILVPGAVKEFLIGSRSAPGGGYSLDAIKSQRVSRSYASEPSL
jgi:hypothetical protein